MPNTNGQRCLLGKVVWMETGHRLTVLSWKMQTENLYPGRPKDPNGDSAKQDAATFAIDDVAAGDILARCKHGTWLIKREWLRPAVERSQKTGKTVFLFANWTFHPEPRTPNSKPLLKLTRRSIVPVRSAAPTSALQLGQIEVRP
jgi:hypothetical protein